VWTFTESTARAIACTAGQTITTPLIPGLVVLADELSS
jgi:hypothetical protein